MSGIRLSKGCLLVALLINMLYLMPCLSEESISGSNNTMADVIVISSEKRGYEVYLDNTYIGSDGQKGDELDGRYRLSVTGNMNHSIIADDGNFAYGLSSYYFKAVEPFVISIDSPRMKLGASNKARIIDSQTKHYSGQEESTASNQNELIKSEYNISPTNSNVPPMIESLNPDLQSPQEIGAIVTWMAQASDQEGDPIYYRFLLNGPRTGDKWYIVQDWSANSAWPWVADETDIGKSHISVQIRDGNHDGTSNMDDLKNSTSYEIRAKQLTSLNVQVVNDVYSKEDPRIYYCQEGKYYYIRNRLYLSGPDCDKVASVKYILPPSFPNPEQISEDANNNFEIWVLTWGKFNDVALVTTKSGQQFEIPYSIAFKDKVNMAKAQGIPMVENCEG